MKTGNRLLAVLMALILLVGMLPAVAEGDAAGSAFASSAHGGDAAQFSGAGDEAGGKGNAAPAAQAKSAPSNKQSDPKQAADPKQASDPKQVGNDGKTDLPGNDGGTDLPGNDGGTDLPGNDGGKTDLPGNDGKTDLPGDNGKTDLPGNDGGTDLPGDNGGKTDLPGDNGGKTGAPDNGGDGLSDDDLLPVEVLLPDEVLLPVEVLLPDEDLLPGGIALDGGQNGASAIDPSPSPVMVTVEVEASPADGGTASVSGDSTVYLGESVNITANPNEAYYFAGWYAGEIADENRVSTEATSTYRPLSNIKLTARFVMKTDTSIDLSTNPNRNYCYVDEKYTASFVFDGKPDIQNNYISVKLDDKQCVYEYDRGSKVFSLDLNDPRYPLTPGQHTLTIGFDGTETIKPCSRTFNFTVNSGNVEVNPDSVDFGTRSLGYAALSPTPVTLRNETSESVTVGLFDVAESFNAAPVDGSGQPISVPYTLEANKTVNIAVNPVTGLAAGDYNENLKIVCDDGASKILIVPLSFKVTNSYILTGASATGSMTVDHLGNPVFQLSNSGSSFKWQGQEAEQTGFSLASSRVYSDSACENPLSASSALPSEGYVTLDILNLKHTLDYSQLQKPDCTLQVGGYTAACTSISVNGNTAKLVFKLTRSSGKTKLKLVDFAPEHALLNKSFTISGRVVTDDANETPVEGVDVALTLSPSHHAVQSTDVDGYFEFVCPEFDGDPRSELADLSGSISDGTYEGFEVRKSILFSGPDKLVEVKATAQGPGSVTGGAAYPRGTSVTLTAKPKPVGYDDIVGVFRDWYDPKTRQVVSTTAIYTFDAPDEDIELVARFRYKTELYKESGTVGFRESCFSYVVRYYAEARLHAIFPDVSSLALYVDGEPFENPDGYGKPLFQKGQGNTRVNVCGEGMIRDTHTFRLAFSGDDDFAPCETTFDVDMGLYPTKLTLDLPATTLVRQACRISGTLTAVDNGNEVPLQGEDVDIDWEEDSINSVRAYEYVDGKARFEFVFTPDGLGKLKIVATYKGNGTCAPCSVEREILVVKPAYSVVLTAEGPGTASGGGGSFAYDQEVTVTATPSHMDAVFDGWYKTSTDEWISDLETYSFNVQDDVSLTAKFVMTYEVILDMNGGTFNGESSVTEVYRDGHEEELPDRETMEGWLAAGDDWITAPPNGEYLGVEYNGKIYKPGEILTVTGPGTAKVLWFPPENNEDNGNGGNNQSNKSNKSKKSDKGASGAKRAVNDCCAFVLTGAGEGVAEYARKRCPDHQRLADMAKAMLGYAITPAAEAEIWRRIEALWRDALDREYNLLLAAADEATRPLIEAERKAFAEQLESRRLSMNVMWPEFPAFVSRVIAEMLERRVAELCFARRNGRPMTFDAAGAKELPAAESTHRCRCEDGGDTLRETLCDDHRALKDAEWLEAARLRLTARVPEGDAEAEAAMQDDLAAFEGWLDARTAVLNALHPGAPELVEEAIALSVRTHTLRLCEEP